MDPVPDRDQNTIACAGPEPVVAAPACVVVIHGDGLGQRADLDEQALVIGRSNDARMCIRSAGISRMHCEIRHEAGHYILRDLASTNGTRIGGNTVTEARLADGDLITIGGSVLKFISQATHEAAFHLHLSRQLSCDQLTGLLGRRQFVESAEQRIEQARRNGTPLSVALVDVDGLQHASLGIEHAQLSAVADLIRARLQHRDLAARIDQHAFALLLDGRGSTQADALIADIAATANGISIHAGVAQLQPGLSSLGQLIKHIRQAMPAN